MIMGCWQEQLKTKRLSGRPNRCEPGQDVAVFWGRFDTDGYRWTMFTYRAVRRVWNYGKDSEKCPKFPRSTECVKTSNKNTFSWPKQRRPGRLPSFRLRILVKAFDPFPEKRVFVWRCVCVCWKSDTVVVLCCVVPLLALNKTLW